MIRKGFVKVGIQEVKLIAKIRSLFFSHNRIKLSKFKFADNQKDPVRNPEEAIIKTTKVERFYEYDSDGEEII